MYVHRGLRILEHIERLFEELVACLAQLALFDQHVTERSLDHGHPERVSYSLRGL